MKKILYVWKSPYPWDVRVEKVCRTLAGSGFDVTILARWKPGQSEYEEIENIKIIRIGYRLPGYLSSPLSANPYWRRQIDKTIAEIKPSLIIPREFFLAEACSDIGHKYNIPVIIDMAEHYPAAMRGWDKYFINYLLRFLVHYIKTPDYLEKRAVMKADGIICVSDELRKRLINLFNFQDEKIAVVHNTPDKEIFKNVRTGSSSPPVVFGYHGYFSPDRNLEKLVEGFILAARQLKHIHLVMAGDMTDTNDCLAIAADSDVNNRIHFTGKYNHDELIELYSETDIGLLPYKNNEFINHIISNKFFDYLACGKPVIISEAAPMKRILSEYVAGITVDCSKAENIAEAILKMSSLNLESMSANGLRAYNEKYNWETDSMNLLNFINGFC